MGKLYDLYIRLMVLLGAELPEGYEDLSTEAKVPQKQIETVKSKPKPEPVKPKPEPVKPKPEPVKPKPEPVKPKPEPVKPKPEPVKPKPEPVKPKPEPVKPKHEPIKPEPKFVKPVVEEDFFPEMPEEQVAPLPDWMPSKRSTAEAITVPVTSIMEEEGVPLPEFEEVEPVWETEPISEPLPEFGEVEPVWEAEPTPEIEAVSPLPIVDLGKPPTPKVEPSRPTPIIKPMPIIAPTPELAQTLNIDPHFPPIGSLESVRALYISYFAIGHAAVRQQIFELLDSTEFNAVVIDVKGDHSWISYPTQSLAAKEIGADRPSVKNFDEVMAQFKQRNIYTIGRIVTFKDDLLARSYPEYAVKVKGSTELWQDREGLSWSDPFATEAWDYNIELAVEAAQKGFDEIQFDYVRFPTLSPSGEPQFSQEVTKESRVSTIAGFLSMARGQLKPFGVKLAADTFGYTCWRKDDTLIGQDIERLGQYVDVLCPMLYPSTFANGIPGYKNAVAYPYEVVYRSAQQAVERIQRLGLGCTVRPWIQDFQDYRFDHRLYGKAEIQAQIKGCFDSGSEGFMVWNPHVEYTTGAYAPVVKYA